MVQNSIATPATHRWGNGSASEALNLPHHTLYRGVGCGGAGSLFKVRCGKRSACRPAAQAPEPSALPRRQR